MVIDATARFAARRKAAEAARAPQIDPITARLQKMKESLRGTQPTTTK